MSSATRLSSSALAEEREIFWRLVACFLLRNARYIDRRISKESTSFATAVVQEELPNKTSNRTTYRKSSMSNHQQTTRTRTSPLTGPVRTKDICLRRQRDHCSIRKEQFSAQDKNKSFAEAKTRT
ncbi:hypothetical protein BaRGS_00015921 [Batillaria attramentaria]|uniref:Uncharacterized protein n=1 Tax=Batillaria attramentaria TaxID=370345 RepID=A0ABD0L0N5_9CAEN